MSLRQNPYQSAARRGLPLGTHRRFDCQVDRSLTFININCPLWVLIDAPRHHYREALHGVFLTREEFLKVRGDFARVRRGRRKWKPNRSCCTCRGCHLAHLTSEEKMNKSNPKNTQPPKDSIIEFMDGQTRYAVNLHRDTGWSRTGDDQGMEAIFGSTMSSG